MPEAVLVADRIRVDYPSLDGVVEAVVDVSLDVVAGRLLVLAGPSGSGKSSLLRVLGMLDRPTSGRVLLDGRDLASLSDRARRRHRRSTAYVHQRPVLNLVDRLTVEEQVALSLQLHRRPVTGVAEVLARFGLEHRRHSRPTDLSGGEQQRVAIAAATAFEPVVLFADEPTAALDRVHADEVIAALTETRRGGQTAVVASHDPAVIERADVVVWLHEGRRIA